jgi:spermidine/putrescine transport system permease protein
MWSIDAYTSLLSDPLYLSIAKTTVIIATSAMLIQLIIGVPLAYVMAFKAGRFEIPMLLGLVILDELNPVVRIYAWRMLLGRNGIINGALESLGIIDQPIDALLFNKFAVILVLSTGWITYTIIPIYAAMKAIDPRLFQAAQDLGAGWWTITRRILLPLAAPGIFVAVLLVYIPLFTDFAAPSLVGGTSGYMLGQAVNDLILGQGDLARGAALSFMLLLATGVVAVVAYRLARINRLET